MRVGSVTTLVREKLLVTDNNLWEWVLRGRGLTLKSPISTKIIKQKSIILLLLQRTENNSSKIMSAMAGRQYIRARTNTNLENLNGTISSSKLVELLKGVSETSEDKK